MKFEIRHLKAFLALAECLHFNKAAQKSFITQPALSRLIRNLEDELKAELFIRTTRNVRLTEAGKIFLEQVELSLKTLEKGVHLVNRVSSGDIGHLVLGYNDFSINLDLPRVLENFKERFPYIDIELNYMPTHKQIDAIKDCSIDIGFIMDFQGNEYRKDSLLLSEETISVVVPKKHFLANRKSIQLKELKDEAFIMGSESDWKAFREQIFILCEGAGFYPKIVQEATTSSGILGLISAGMGISLYVHKLADRMRNDLVSIPLEDHHNKIYIRAIWNKNYDNSSCFRFREVIMERQFVPVSDPHKDS
ncbi:LysR family transcriptional regulator [Marinomonas foliarum]|uniref:LysR family transcriptional regulator n=1 Tax=Marinomonas foliarum TaxID=491950 RepID=A0ABX7IN09_9GAMM|nr:LysR substrate-binding domain-containing protein [Marinomonas foliarum]QRV23391.1 LysR family transcriptional regulator [Marinomonas foliarum]|tara:strand:+ start:4460 stop:5380 length:921 start_codon:yes stop_codon:yes gene_type:complete